MSQNLREQFLAIARNEITRPGIENLLKHLEGTDFFEAPASTKYHGCYEGGLVQHCIDVYNALHDELAFIYGDNYLAMYSEETIAIVSLFHDLCKVGRYAAGTRNVKDPVTKQWHEEPTYFYNQEAFEMGHGAASVFMVQKFIDLEDFEAQAIFWHMGAYDISNYMSLNGLGSAYERNTLAFALHRADMMATYVTDNEHFKNAPEADYEDDVVEDSGYEDDNVEEVENIVDDVPEEDVVEDAPEEEFEDINDTDDVQFNAADYDDWSIDDIKAEIEEWGGEPKKRAKRSELLKQLERLMTQQDDDAPPFD